MTKDNIDLDDEEFEAVMENAVKEMGKVVREVMESRRANGIPDPVYDTSPKRQAEVIEKLEQEITRLRPSRKRLFGE